MVDLVNVFLTCAKDNTEAYDYRLAIANLESALHVRGLSPESYESILRVMLKLQKAEAERHG